MLKPADIQEKEFEIKMRGYDRDQVDDFLDELIRDMNTLYKDNAALTEQVNKLTVQVTEFKAMESSMKQSMDLTRYQCEEMKKTAQAEAEHLISDAKIRSKIAEEKVQNYKIRIKGICEELLEKLEQI